MAADAQDGSGFSLRRWSQRKLAAQRGVRTDATAHVDGDAQRPATAAPVPAADADQRPNEARATPPRSDGATGLVAAPAASAPSTTAAAEPPLPPVESLTFESDFSLFMRPGVDSTVRRAALRKLLRDPRFNMMDGLDVYIDDYSKPSPIEPEVVRGLMQARYIFAPPKTRVTAEGCVEDMPDEAPTADASTETASAREAADAPSPVASAPEAISVTPPPDAHAQAAIAPVGPSAVPEAPATTPSRHE
jgi:hypothetical protein